MQNVTLKFYSFSKVLSRKLLNFAKMIFNIFRAECCPLIHVSSSCRRNNLSTKKINFLYYSCTASAFKFGHEIILIDNK